MNHTSSFQRVTRDVLDLVELQMQLLSVDSQAAKRKLVRAIACGATAATIAGSALTVLFIGLGAVLGEYTTLSIGGGLLVIGAIAFALVTILLLISLAAVNAAAAAMKETKSEFAENLRWIKATIISPHGSARNEIRSDSFPDSPYVNDGTPAADSTFNRPYSRR